MKPTKKNKTLFDISIHLSKIKKLLPELNDEERLEIFHNISEDYCEFCGSKYLPCYCNNDD